MIRLTSPNNKPIYIDHIASLHEATPGVYAEGANSIVNGFAVKETIEEIIHDR